MRACVRAACCVHHYVRKQAKKYAHGSFPLLLSLRVRRTSGKDKPAGLRERAFTAARSGDASLAAELFSEYLQKPEGKGDVAALNACGAMSAQLGNLELAVDHFKQATISQKSTT